jgi:hypothetical protein
MPNELVSQCFVCTLENERRASNTEQAQTGPDDLPASLMDQVYFDAFLYSFRPGLFIVSPDMLFHGLFIAFNDFFSWY